MVDQLDVFFIVGENKLPVGYLEAGPKGLWEPTALKPAQKKNLGDDALCSDRGPIGLHPRQFLAYLGRRSTPVNTVGSLRSRLTQQMQHHAPPVRGRAVLEQIKALPRPERHASGEHRDGELRLGERGA